MDSKVRQSALSAENVREHGAEGTEPLRLAGRTMTLGTMLPANFSKSDSKDTLNGRDRCVLPVVKRAQPIHRRHARGSCGAVLDLDDERSLGVRNWVLAPLDNGKNIATRQVADLREVSGRTRGHGAGRARPRSCDPRRRGRRSRRQSPTRIRDSGRPVSLRSPALLGSLASRSIAVNTRRLTCPSSRSRSFSARRSNSTDHGSAVTPGRVCA